MSRPDAATRYVSAAALAGDGISLTVPREYPVVGRALAWPKRVVDILGSSVLLVLLSPVLAVVAVLAWLQGGGSPMFIQDRVGQGGRLFRIMKFRTMVRDADRLTEQVESLNRAPGGVMFLIPSDPRITPIGHWLRRLSLDELPQLFNVLKGEMSLVGPRPLQLRDALRLEAIDPEQYMHRSSVRPGITGLAQVSGRRDLDPTRILECDSFYARNCSLLFDLKILFRTIPAVLNSRGVY